MTTIPAEEATSFPYWVVNIFIKDHNGHDICSGPLFGFAGAPTLTFLVANGGTGASRLPDTGVDDPSLSGTVIGDPTATSLLAALKTWAENQDWNTGYTWTGTATTSGATVTPVSFDSINITEVTGTEFTSSDITPA